MIRLALTCLVMVALSAVEACAQGQLCRTSPAGASTSYCASEAFVSQQFPSSATTAGDLASFSNTTGQLQDSGIALSANPGNLYVSTSGNDSNTCLAPGSACLTIQHAVSIAQKYYLNAAPVTINLAAGTYVNGTNVIGISEGGAGAASMIKIVGAGSGTTTINLTANCSPANNLSVTNGAIVGIGSVKLLNSCSGGNGILAANGGLAFLVDSDVNFGAINGAMIFATYAKFDANYNGPQSFTMSGNATYGFEISTHGIVVTGVGVANVISGTPAFSGTFLSVLDGSFYNEGIGGTWTNAANATGSRYAIALNAHIDREQNAGNLPGSTPGTVEGVSVYYQNNGGTSDTPCIGGAVGCRSTTSPTGLGTGGTASFLSGSGDHSGAIQLNIGTAPPGAGTVVVAHVSILTGDYGGRGFCVVSPNNNAGSWPSPTLIQSFYDTVANGGLHVAWTAALSASTTYYISYVCN